MAFPYVRHSADWKDANSATGGGDESTPITATAMDTIEAGIDSLSNILENADAAGDLLVASGADAWTKLAKGADDAVLSVSSGALAYRKIVNVMVDAAAAIAISKLADYPSDATKYLRGDATWAAAGAASLTAALPGSPANGDEIILVDSVSAPTYAWHLRYISAKASNKWQFVGGSPLIGETATSETRTNTAYGDLSGGATGPSVTLPVAGDYIVSHGADLESSSAAIAFMSYDIGASGAVDADGVRVDLGIGFGGSHMRSTKKAGLTAVALTCKYKSSAGTLTALNRFIQALPIAIGG